MIKVATYLNCRYFLTFVGNTCTAVHCGNDHFRANEFSRRFPALYMALLQKAR